MKSNGGKAWREKWRNESKRNINQGDKRRRASARRGDSRGGMKHATRWQRRGETPLAQNAAPHGAPFGSARGIKRQRINKRMTVSGGRTA